MSKKNKLMKIIRWFFEEDSNDQDDISFNLTQIVIIALFTILFMIWILYQPLKEIFIKPVPSACEYIEANIEDSYFKQGSGIKNNDFSNGLDYWATSDGGTLFPDSKSIASIENKDFHSSPSCMKIECIVPSNRYHYSKKKNTRLVNNAYSYKESSCWLGVVPGKDLKASLWYKGDIVKFSVNYLTADGEWGNLANVTGQASSKWLLLEINRRLPLNARAVMLEITLNQAQGMPLPRALIDDVNMAIE